MAEQSRAEGLFEKIKSAGDEAAQAAALRKLATDRTAEDEYVEFKSGIYNEKDTGKYWSQALSAFANTEGGVLIFGVKTDKVDTGGTRPIDTAVGVELVDKPEVLEQFLKDTRLNSSVDPVPGVQYLRVTEPGGKGFVVAYIPEGPHKPYRAATDPSRNYFHRVGDSFAIINHTHLRNLFYPRLRSNLQVEILAGFTAPTSPNDKSIKAQFNIDLRNIGRSSAREIVCMLNCNRAISAKNSNALIAVFPIKDRIGWQVTSAKPLHPGESLDFLGIMTQFDPFDYAKTTVFEFSFFMLDQEPLYYRAEFKERDIMFSTGKVFATAVESL